MEEKGEKLLKKAKKAKRYIDWVFNMLNYSSFSKLFDRK